MCVTWFCLRDCEWKIAEASEVRCSSVGLPVRLYGKCQSVFFGGIGGNRACWREWQRQTPCGLENMPGPEPTWAKIEDTAPLCCSFSARLPVSLLSFSFSLLFLVSPPPYFCPSLFLLHLSPSFFFFPPSFVCSVSAPPVSHYSNPIYEGDKHMRAHIVFLSMPLFFFVRLFRLFCQSFSQIHVKEDNATKCLKWASCKQDIIIYSQTVGTRKRIFIFHVVTLSCIHAPL